MKQNILKWIVLNYDCNARVIREYDVLAWRTNEIKQLKKEAKNKTEFSELLRRTMMRQYWSRAEYELILERKDNNLYLKPWCGCSDPDAVAVNVTQDEFWVAFAKSSFVSWRNSRAKIDIYDQLMFKWEEIVDYCWNTHLPYERKRKD